MTAKNGIINERHNCVFIKNILKLTIFTFLVFFIELVFLFTLAGSFVRCFIDETLTMTTMEERALVYEKKILNTEKEIVLVKMKNKNTGN